MQFVAAVSDADGPEPRPYTFELKPDEEKKFRQKLLAMAADEVRGHIAKISVASTPEDNALKQQLADYEKFVRAEILPKARSDFRLPPEEYAFNLDQYGVDMPPAQLIQRAHSAFDDIQAEMATLAPLVAQQKGLAVTDYRDVIRELKKQQISGSDILPRYDFIDAVDADGDGRGELLFRETWDSGTAFAVYRVLGDRLWPLFEGKPGS